MDIFAQQIINGLVLGSIYALVALGYTMVYGILGLINFAHGDIVMVGALTALTVITALAGGALPAAAVLALALLAAVLVCTTLGVGIERVAYRPLRRAPRLAPLITAIGVSILIQYTAALVWSKQYISLPPILKPAQYTVGGASITDLQIFIFVLACAIMAALLWFIRYTRIGKAMRATEQNRDVAGLMGIDTNRIITFTFLLGSGLGAVAGLMVVLYYGIGHYFMGFMLGLKAFTAAVLGGIGKVNGAVLGGLLLGLIESLASGYIGDLTGGVLGSNYRDIFAFLVLVVVLVFRPSGLIGEPASERARGDGDPAAMKNENSQESVPMIAGRWRWTALGRHPLARLAVFVLLAAVLLALPFAVDALLGRAWVRIIDVALLFIMLALGLNIVVGYAGLLDLGYVAFFAVGAYAYALLASPQFGIHLSFLVLLPLGALVAAFFGVLLGAPTLKLRGDYLAIVTLGFGEIIRIFLNNLNRPVNITNGPLGITLIDPLQAGGIALNKTYTVGSLAIAPVHSYYFVFLLCACLFIVISLRLEDSRVGRAWIAIREDETAARAMGINTRNVKLLAFAMGATFGGVSGGLFAAFQGFISPESFTLLDSIMILCMVVLGGMGHVPGVVLGAVLLTALPEALRYVGPLQRDWFGQVYIDPADLRMLMFGLALVLMMLFRPAGLWPSKVRRREFAT